MRPRATGANARAPGRTALAALFGGAVLLAACGALLGLEDPTHRDSIASEAGPNADARTPVGLGCSATCVVDADPSAGVYVDGASGADTTACGTAAAPCKSIRAGIQAARARVVREVYVASGSYRESISLFAGIDVIGGFSPSASGWTRSCAPDSPRTTILQAPDNADRTVVADNLGGDTKLEALRITSKRAAAIARGESVYGVFARATSTTLCLRDVEIDVGNAGDGSEGDAGAAGELIPCVDGGSGATGASGDAGAPATTGAFGSDGYLANPATAGRDGVAGQPSMFVVGSCSQQDSPGLCPPCQKAFVNADCHNDQAPAVACPIAPHPGCGGGAGRGGMAGGSGGSAFALYVVDATVDVIGGSLVAGNGGAGGAGGAGANGADGGTGATGTCPLCDQIYPTCMTTFEAPIGAVTANGGTGGRGGAGGAGAAGHSCAIYESPFASVQVSATTQKRFGSARQGRDGAPGGNAKEICP